MEIELKFLVEEPLARDRILKDKHLQKIKDKGSEEELEMHAYYLDTENLDLSKSEATFRIRYENNMPVATLKWGDKVEAALHTRGELNVPVDEEYIKDPSLGIFKGSPVYEELQKLEGKKLSPIMEMKFTRKQIMVDTGHSISAVSLDVGEIITPKGSAPISELEVELYSGDQEDMIALGQELAAKYNLREGVKSKFRTGLDLLELDK